MYPLPCSRAERIICMVTAVVGANWGDEGKGRITDLLSQDSDIVVRYQGGSNAGHTIINDYGRFALHAIPSGVFYSHVTNVIGNGVALNVENVIKEIDGLIRSGVPQPKLLVSNRAQIVMPYHILFDEYEEERLGKNSFGSTKSGIAPFYSDKFAKIGFQVSELFGSKAALQKKLSNIVHQKNIMVEHLYHKPALKTDEIFETLMQYKEMIAPYVCDTAGFLQKALSQNHRILLEGQLGTLRDPDFGIYPMTTSSSTLAAYGAVGAGLPPYLINRIVAVVKAYSTAAGAGAFVSEIYGKDAENLRALGGDSGEYGATTGRARRVGWFDAVASRYGCKMQGATEAALTVVDVLEYLDELPVCVAYEYKGQRLTEFPTTDILSECKPIYQVLPGWKTDIRGIRDFAQLPKECKDYIHFIESELGVKITMVSNGPKRDEIIHVR